MASASWSHLLNHSGGYYDLQQYAISNNTTTGQEQMPPAHTSDMPQPASALKPHVTVTPMACLGTSSVPERGLAVIEWVLFDGIQHNAAVKLFNDRGYNKGKPVRTRDAIGHVLRRYGRQWYAEQGVVRPWKLYNKKEQDELRAQGLGPNDFPCVDPRGEKKAESMRPSERLGTRLSEASQMLPATVGASPSETSRASWTTPLSSSIPPLPVESINYSLPSLTFRDCSANASMWSGTSLYPMSPYGQRYQISKESGDTSLNQAPPLDLTATVPDVVDIAVVPDRYRAEVSLENEWTEEMAEKMDALKVEILRLETEWKEACQTGNATIADSVEEALENLEEQAKALDKKLYLSWRATTWS